VQRAAEPPQTTIDCVSGLAFESTSTDTETTTTFHDQVVSAVGNDHHAQLRLPEGHRDAPRRQDGDHRKVRTGSSTCSRRATCRIVQGDRVATCGRAEVFPGEDRIVLTENPVVSIESEHYKATGPSMVLYRGQRQGRDRGDARRSASHITLPAIKDLGFPAEKPADNPPEGQPAK
jgi:lipopolysaccharide export system protein LptA